MTSRAKIVKTNISIVAPNGDKITIPAPTGTRFTTLEQHLIDILLSNMYWHGGIPLRLFYGTYESEDEYDWMHTVPVASTGVLDPRLDQMPFFITFDGIAAVSQSTPFDWSTCQDRNCYQWCPNTPRYLMMLPTNGFEVLWMHRDPHAEVGESHFLLPLGSGYYGISFADLLLLGNFENHREGVREVLALTDWDSTVIEPSILQYLTPTTMRSSST